VRIIHKPTGMIVFCADGRSQQRIRPARWRCSDRACSSSRRTRRRRSTPAQRRGQIGSGDRSERIRTYNFPQNRLTDHRVGLTLYNLPQVMEGRIDEVIARCRRPITKRNSPRSQARPMRRRAGARKTEHQDQGDRAGAGLLAIPGLVTAWQSYNIKSDRSQSRCHLLNDNHCGTDESTPWLRLGFVAVGWIAGRRGCIDHTGGKHHEMTSVAWMEGQPIPVKFTCDGADVSPL